MRPEEWQRSDDLENLDFLRRWEKSKLGRLIAPTRGSPRTAIQKAVARRGLRGHLFRSVGTMPPKFR